MDTKQLEYLVTIAEEKSLSRAAEKLYLSQSALSQQLAKLKADGLPPLFYRHKGEMLLTDAGRIYINGARIIMKIREDTQRLMAGIGETPTRHLRLAICRRLQPIVFTRLLPMLRQVHPDLDISVTMPISLQMRRAIADGQIDLAVFEAGRPENEVMAYTVLAEEELVVAHAPGALPAELPILLPPPDTHARRICDEAIPSMIARRRLYAEIDDLSVVRSLVGQGECTAILPLSCLAGTDLAHERFAPPYRFFTVAARRPGPESPLLREVIGKLQDLIADRPWN